MCMVQEWVLRVRPSLISLTFDQFAIPFPKIQLIAEYAGAPYQEVATKAWAHLDRLADLYATPARKTELTTILTDRHRMSRGRLFFSVRLERLADNANVVDRVRERAKPALVILVADGQGDALLGARPTGGAP